jgi:hypothetical protein
MEVDELTLRYLHHICEEPYPEFEFISPSFHLFSYRMALLTYKHKTHVLDNDQRIVSNADVDFYIDNVISSAAISYLHYDEM